MITIRNPETARSARELAERTGETMDDAVARTGIPSVPGRP